jgi:hypothetical protein
MRDKHSVEALIAAADKAITAFNIVAVDRA